MKPHLPILAASILPLSLYAQAPAAPAAPAPAATQAPAPAAPAPKPATPAPKPGEIRRIPPAGVAVPDTVRAELTAGVMALGKTIDELKSSLKDHKLLTLLPDVQIFHKAVDWALRYDEFFDPKQFDAAKRQLALGMDRANSLKNGQAPWTTQTGLVVRGYVSKIDGSVQPYGLIIPETYKASAPEPTRLDFWLHGRGEKLSELSFIDERLSKRGEFAPPPANEQPLPPGKAPYCAPITNPPAIVAHLYERYCNANKFAGELDLFETLDAVKANYKIDDNRLVVRVFSMGGAGCWQYATHFAGMWAAAAPGAGFAETAEFIKAFAPGKTPPPAYEQVLWRWYDATLYAANLFNTTTIAYSGEVDGQKQAADIMTRYMAKEGLTLTHLIGPKMPHKYDPMVRIQIEEKVAEAVRKGREEEPKEVKFTTYTLIYPHMEWVRVEGLEKHWERTDVVAKLEGNTLTATTKNVSVVRFTPPKTKVQEVVLDGQKLPAGSLVFHRAEGKWAAGEATGPRKTPELCGPVDHAFMSSFLMVRPTGKARSAKVDAWTKRELDHALSFWRQVYRGDAPVKDDTAISEKDIAENNLVLWGDPQSNQVLAKLIGKLPLKWEAAKLTLGAQSYAGEQFAPILVFPNPLNSKKYVVLNSGVTYREKALLNNSDQTPKLPDWAIIDTNTPAGPEWPGRVEAAGFFDEQWKPGAPLTEAPPHPANPANKPVAQN